ncbi:MAG: cytochrome c biogenesis protein ResB [Actinomycetota bacterium]
MAARARAAYSCRHPFPEYEMTTTTTSRPLRSPLDALRALWRTVRTMRTALILLLLLAAGASVGSLFPQRPINPATVEQWIARNRHWAPFAEKLGLFDVFGSWWFMAIYILLLVSLVGCIVPRYRAFFRSLRARPRTSATLSVQPQYRSGTVALSPDVALSGAERVLRSKRFRLARANGTIAGEKGHLREGGSLIFHTAFLVLLLGMSIGKLYGFTGQVAVVEGERFTDTQIDYDSITMGRLFDQHFRGFQILLDDFNVTWYPDGVPRTFASSIRLFDHGRLIKSPTIQVNHPLTYRGVRVYQISWGWAPVIHVSQRGKVLYDGPTIFLPRQGVWRGVVKVPETKPLQMGLDMFFFTDAQRDTAGDVFNGSPQPLRPIIGFEQYLGDLGLTTAQSVYELDPSGLALAQSRVVPMGQSVTLPDGIEVAFTGLKQYSVFQLAANPGAPILLAAAVLILVGLIPALYSSRRRVWVRAAAHNGVARLEIAGQAMQRKAAFEEEFKTLVRDLDKELVRDLDKDMHHTIGVPDG